MYKLIKNAEDWNTRITTSPDGGLLQSRQWGKFQESLGNVVFNVSDEGETWFAQAIQLKAGHFSILSVPRGPVFKAMPSKESLSSFVEGIKGLAKDRGCFLVRFDPPYSASHLPPSTFHIRKAKPRNPVHTLIIDTSPTEARLLEQMKPKHRYNIRVAEKKGLTTRWSSDPDDAKAFFDLVKQTTGRQQFGSYDEGYFRSMMATFGPSDNAKFVLAEYQGKIIAGLLIAFFGNRAYYLHGASDYEHRSMMAPHLLQWEAIKEAKRRGMNYDLWGVATDPPSNKQEEGWQGITRFKKGFSPKTKTTEYTGTYETPVKKSLYYLYKVRSALMP